MASNKGYVLADANGQPVGLTAQYAEMYAYNEAITFNIDTQDKHHALHGISAPDIVAGALSGWTFDAGRNVDANIANESDVGGKLGIECSGNHGLTTGDVVVITKANNAAHNAPTRVTTTGLTTFTRQDINYAAGAGASDAIVDKPAILIASGAGAAGVYLVTLTLDGTAANANKTWKWEVWKTVTAQDNIVTERFSTNSLASMTTAGMVTIAVGDVLWIAGKNSTDTTDYTVKNFNLNAVKIQ